VVAALLYCTLKRRKRRRHMMRIGERDVLLKVIEQLGREWEEKARPEDIRLSQERIEILLNVRALVANADVDLSIELLRERCPAFLGVYRAVMLRDIEELIPDGATE
jgi:hypothetical protein